jgi:ABC-type multidrug transport system ATPase subunit
MPPGAEQTAAVEKPGSEQAPERPADAPAIELEGLRRDYGERTGLARVSLRLDQGQSLAVLGANGSGKTTLLRVLAGLLRPSAGRAAVLGCELPNETWQLRGRVGYLGHQPLLYRDLSGRENLRLAAALNGIEGQRAEGRIAELLAAVGMERRADQRTAELSAGMRQRLDICRTVLHGPELLLLDEPEAHLDSEARALADRLIGPGTGRTRVVVSHDRERALAGADLALELR